MEPSQAGCWRCPRSVSTVPSLRFVEGYVRSGAEDVLGAQMLGAQCPCSLEEVPESSPMLGTGLGTISFGAMGSTVLLCHEARP